MTSMIEKSNALLAPDRPRARLIGFKAVRRNTLRGFADIELLNGLQLFGIVIGVAANGKPFAVLPGRPVVGLDGETLSRDGSGRINYAPIVRWRDGGLHRHFCNFVIKLIRERHPDVFGDAP